MYRPGGRSCSGGSIGYQLLTWLLHFRLRLVRWLLTTLVPHVSCLETEQDSPATSMDTITHDFGDLGGLGAGAAAGSYLRMNGAAAALPPSDTQSAIDKLHARMVPPDLPVPDVAAAAAPGFPMGVHEEYLAQQEALRVQRQQQQQWHPPHGQQHWPPAHEQHQQHTHSALFQMHQQWQLQQQHQQHQLFQAQEQQQLIQHEQQRQLQEQQAHSHAAIVAPAKQPPPPPHAPPPVGRNISNGSGAQEESGKTAPLYGSVEELLAAVGYLNLLPNFLEQEFDVNAIALMQDRDFEEIQVTARRGMLVSIVLDRGDPLHLRVTV